MEERKQSRQNEVQQAQQDVDKSLSTFEGAMDELAQAIGEAGAVIHHLMDFAKGPTQELKLFGEKIREITNDVKKNPQPYALAIGAALAYIGYRTWQKREVSRARFSADAGY